MMKMNSIIHTYPLPLALPTHRAVLRFVGFTQTPTELSANGYPLEPFFGRSDMTVISADVCSTSHQ